MPIRCQYFANYLPIECQSHVNTMPIFWQSTVNPSPIHCQSSPNAGQIHCQSMSIQIHIDANPLPIHCQFAANSGQPTSDAAQMQPIYRSDFPMPIRDQSANPEKICQFIPFFPIHCRSDGNPDPIENQSMVNPVPIKVNPPPIQCQSVGNLDQSIPNSPVHQFNPMTIRANPVPIISQSRSIQCQSTPDPASIWWPSGSIHCQSSSFSVPILGQSNTNPVSILDSPPIKCQSWTYLPNSDPWPIHQFNANSIPILYQVAHPSPIHKSNTNPPIH